MELLELINLQFAVPVLGVFICALLVFTLGFKSPVPPPSNIYAITQVVTKKKGKSRKSPKKSLNNGQLHKTESRSPKVAVNSDSETERKEKKEDLYVDKMAKEVKTQPQSLAQVQDMGGDWVTPKPRKRLQKSSIKIDDQAADVIVMSQDMTIDHDNDLFKPVRKQRAKNENNYKETNSEPVKITQEPVKTTPEAITTTPEAITTTPEAITTTPEAITTTPEPVTTAPEPITTTTGPVTTTPEPITTTPGPVKTRKESKQKKVTSEREKVDDHDISPKDFSKQMTSDLSDATSAQMFVEQQLHEAATDIGDGSRNKKNSMSVAEVGCTPVSSSEQVVDYESVTKSTHVPTEAVTFNEMGWEEAKPAKKKKKSRRD